MHHQVDLQICSNSEKKRKRPTEQYLKGWACHQEFQFSTFTDFSVLFLLSY